MATQSQNIIDIEQREQLRQTMSGTREAVTETVGAAVDYVAQPVVTSYREVFVDAPALKTAVFFTVLGYILAKF